MYCKQNASVSYKSSNRRGYRGQGVLLFHQASSEEHNSGAYPSLCRMGKRLIYKEGLRDLNGQNSYTSPGGKREAKWASLRDFGHAGSSLPPLWFYSMVNYGAAEHRAFMIILLNKHVLNVMTTAQF